MKGVASFGPFREVALLLKNGFSEATAFGMDDATRSGFCIIFGELEGGDFDWNAMAWKEPKA